MKIAVAGTGYAGVVTGAVLAEAGHNVVCVDVDKKKIDSLKSGKSPIYEAGLEDILREYKQHLTFTTDYTQAYSDADAIFITVGTPERDDGSADLKYVFAVCDQIGQSIEKDCVVVVKSTVPIGTNDIVEKRIRQNLKNNIHVEVASNPEFLAQGTAVHDMRNASRIIIGAESGRALDVMKKIYEKFDCPIFCTDRRSAEMIKYASNDFLALKLAYINEIANLCEALGADVGDVAKGMGFDPRISPYFLNAGIGYGGSCFPKDTKALHKLSVEENLEIETIKAAIEVNAKQKTRLIDKARKHYPSFAGINVAILGLSFKPNTDDLREAPSLDNVPIILKEGGHIKAWDPVAQKNFARLYSDITYCDTIKEALTGADICLIMTEWNEVKALNPTDFNVMKTPIIMDGRNCFSLSLMKSYPLLYDSIGRKVVGTLKT